jgi:hypothetical protein
MTSFSGIAPIVARGQDALTGRVRGLAPCRYR